MRKNLFLLAIAILAFGSDRLQAQTNGGPDLFGYVWKDSNDPAADKPVYAWKDITVIGTNCTGPLTDDNATGPFNIGWNFHYYWVDYDKVKIGSNGWVSFKTTVGNIAHCFPTIPSAGGTADNFLAPLMTDLVFNNNGNAGKVYYWSNNVDSFIVSYENAPWWQNAGPGFIGNNSFQVILSGRDSSITFQYKNIDEASFNDQATCASDIVIGMENLTGNIGLEHSADAAALVPDLYAIKFYYPSTTTFQIQDITPYWAANSENQGQFVLLNGPTVLQAGIKNVGNTNVTSTISARGKLRDIALNNLVPDFDQTLTIPGGVAANVTNVLDYAPYTFNTAGQYTLEITTTTAGGQDANPSNNINKVEISTVLVGPAPTCAHQYTYASNNPPDGAISWSGGGGGAGIKVVPPQYPITVKGIEVFVINGLDSVHAPLPHGFTVEVWSEDANGLPGTMLTSEVVTANNTNNFAWNSVTLTSPQTISQGGFFVSWLTGGDSTLLGTETLDPISRRTWELLNAGSWAPYRMLTQEDFMIRVNAEGCIFVGNESELNSNFSLELYPNPTNGITTVAYELTGNSTPVFSLSNIQGQTVLSKETGKLAAGGHAFTIDTQELAPGIYILNMNVDGQIANRKLVVTK